MAFTPFGYRFELISTLPLAEARASLRAKRVGWFEVKSAPRGWLIGPVFCLWLSAFDRYGPMVFGLCTEHARGTRVRGLAGSDLNGVLMFTLLIALMIFLAFVIAADGAAPAQLLPAAAVFLVAGPLVYWFAHKDRRQAEPLIHFIEDALGKARPRVKRPSRNDSIPPLPMRLLVCEESPNGSIATAEAVCTAIETIRYDPNGFAVLQRDDWHFMQTAAKDGGFALEKREGADAAHVAGERIGDGSELFSAEEVTEALLAYLGGDAAPAGVRWERLRQ